MRASVKVEGTKQFRKNLLRFSKAMGVTIREALIEKAVQSANQLAIQTEPYGKGGKAKKVSESVIGGDFHKVYLSKFHVLHLISSVSKRKGAAYLRAQQEGRWSEADRIMKGALGVKVELGQAANIQARRNKRGRVELAHKTVLVEDYAKAIAYKEELMRNAGMAKAGWYSAVESLRAKKTRKPPVWLRKDSKYGTATVKGDRMGTVVTLKNHIKYTKNVLKPSKVAKALKRDLKGFEKRMDKVISKA